MELIPVLKGWCEGELTCIKLIHHLAGTQQIAVIVSIIKDALKI